MEEVLAGKYRVLRKLATGGMAEVFLARQTGMQGFQKLVVVKRVLPARAKLAEYVQRFIDEARATAELHHPNVVDVFDVGEDENGPFMVMEYLRGEDLRHLMSAAERAGAPLPLGTSLQVIIDAARGLHHAHARTDATTGKKLALVHRDVSPSNLVVTFDGVTKVVDFGIVQYAHRLSEETEEGLVRGKPFYMSPEQASGLPVDARSDQFSLGIILFELTTGRRLHAGSPNTALERVARGDVPVPTDVLPDYPKELSMIVRRALALKPEDRFVTCGVLADTLEAWLDDSRIPHSTSRIAAAMRDAFGGPPDAAPEPRPVERAGPTAATPAGEILPQTEASVTTPGDVPTAASVEARLADRMRERAGTVDSNLPDDPDVLLGRDEDLATIGKLLDGESRLVTLIGPGGAGKTRLALRLAADRRATYRDHGGVWFFDLTEARDVDAIARAVSRTIAAAPAAGEDAVDAIGRALAGRGRTLVVLDNLEQVVEAAATVLERWVNTAPEARFLATSRERLRIRGESPHDVGPLGLPVEGRPPEESAAVRLFLHRAKAVRSSWTPAPADLTAIAELVTLLEGHALAIELAAARVTVLTPVKLLEKLKSGLGVLGASYRTTHQKQATLRAAVEWSWALLTPGEQSALGELSVFRGGFDLEAAEAVVAPAPDAPWVVDTLASLKDKSLLRVRDTEDGSRYDTYLPVREWAAVKLTESGREAAAMQRHAEHFASLAKDLASGVHSHGGLERIRRLAAETENLAAVVERALGGAVPFAPGVTVALALETTIGARNPRGHLAMLDRVLAREGADAASGAVRAAALLGRARAKRVCSSPREAIPDLTEALRLAREAKDDKLVTEALVELGRAAGWSGHRDVARGHLGEALSLARASHDETREGVAATYLGGTLVEVEPEQARQLIDRALGVHHQTGNKRMEAITLQYRSYLLRREGEIEKAMQGYAAAAALFRQIGDRVSEADAAFVRALLAMDEGRLEEAATRFEAVADLAREVGSARTEAYVLANQAILAQLFGMAADAVALHAKAQAAFQRLGNAAMAGFYACFQSMARAQTGDITGANAALDQAREAVQRGGAADLPRLVELAAARLALPGDAESARRLLDDLAKKPATGGHSELDRSEDLRFAARILERAM